MRRRANPVKDKKIFARTAVRTKKINVSPIINRGGTRL